MEQKRKLDLIKIGQFIKERRNRIPGLTQDLLAERLGVSSRTVSKWERGLGMPHSGIVPLLCTELHINERHLYAATKGFPEDIEYVENTDSVWSRERILLGLANGEFDTRGQTFVTRRWDGKDGAKYRCEFSIENGVITERIILEWKYEDPYEDGLCEVDEYERSCETITEDDQRVAFILEHSNYFRYGFTVI